MNSSTPVPSATFEAGAKQADAAERLRQLWLRGQRPDLDTFLASAGPLKPDQVAAVLRVDQAHRWRNGQRIGAEAYLQKCPEVQADPDSSVDLIYGEFMLRERSGERPDVMEYLKRFPQHAQVLKMQIELHQAVEASSVVSESGSNAAGERPADSITLATAAATDTQEAPTVPNYEILSQLGRGGTGVVYKARQINVNRLVALKVILAGAHATAAERRRFRTEAEAAARLCHPNVVPIYEVGAYNGLPYLALEFMDRGNLASSLAGEPLPPRQAAELVELLARALQAVHELGVVHRDLKPANVLFATPAAPANSKEVVPAGIVDLLGVPKITDFGLAKCLNQDGGQTTSGAILGTPNYMAPEQAAGRTKDIGPAADIYALGAILYEALTGQPPFRGATLLETLEMVRSQEPVSPSRLQRLPRDLVTICLKSLAKEPERRYASAAALAEDLRRFQQNVPVAARPITRWERGWRWCRRNPVVAGLSGVVALMLLLGSAGLAVNALVRQERDKALANQERAEKAEAAALALQQEIKIRQHLAQATAARRSRQSGQRFQALAEIRLATNLQPKPELPQALRNLHELRNAVIATLAVPDLYLAGPWNPWPAAAVSVDFDEAHAIYARTDGEGNCSIRRVADDAEIHRLKGLGAPAWVRLNRDGQFVAVGRYTPPIQIQVWQLDGLTPRLLLSEKRSWRAAFHPHAQRVALSYADGAIGVFELPSGRQKSRLPREPALTREVAIALHPTEPLVAVASYFGPVVQVRDVHTGKVLASLPQPARALTVAWHPDGRTLAIGYESQHIRLYDRTTWQAYRTLETGAVVTSIDFDPAGDRLAMLGGWSGMLELFDVGTGQKLMSLPPNTRGACRFSRDGLRLAGAVQGAKLGIWQIAGGQEFRTLERNLLHTRDKYLVAAVHPEGRLLAVAQTDGVGLWDLASGSQRAFIAGSSPNNRVLFEPSGALLTLVGPTGLARWPIRKQANAAHAWVVGPPQRLPLPRGDDLGQSRDGKVIVSCDRAVGAHQAYAGGWILHADRPKDPIRLDAGADINCIAVSPDGRWVVTRAMGGLTKVWDARDGRLVKPLADRVFDFSRFSPDGRWLATRVDGRLLAVETWEPGPQVGAGAVFAPDRDSKLMAVPTTNGIRLVDQATGREVAMLEDPNLDGTDHAVFTPDGAKLIALNIMKGISVWDLRLIRRQLKDLGLDWDWPEVQAPAKADVPRTPLTVQLIDPDAHYQRGVGLAAKRLLDEAAAQFREAMRRTPDHTQARHALARLLNNQAWVLATHAEPKNRAPGRALKLAQEAVELAPKEGSSWNTLGVAHYRCGDWKEASAALTKSMELRNGGNSFDWFFLAMGHWKLHQKKEAGTWYNQAVAWMDKNQPQNEELRRFRAEAAELLGIDKKKD